VVSAAYALNSASHQWVGAYRGGDGWRYIDGTPSAGSIACGPAGCGLWLGGQPDNSNYGSEDKAAIVAANGGRLADYTWNNNFPYTCQTSWSCEDGHVCDVSRGIQVRVSQSHGVTHT
jgi:hypothetical protein